MSEATTETTTPKKTKKSSKKETAIEKKASAEIAEYVDYGEDANQGYDADTANDIQVPRIAVLQALSPQCAPVKEGGIQGAEPGMFYNTVSQEVAEEIRFVIGKVEKCYNEWIPRNAGGGFVARHECNSQLVKDALAKTPRGKIELSNGNELVETVFMYVIPVDADGQPLGGFAVLDFTSTKLSAWRSFNTSLRSFTIQTPQGRKVAPPLFAHTIKATTRRQQNSQGAFYNYALAPMNEADPEKGFSAMRNSLITPNDLAYQQAKELGEMVDAGFAKIQGLENDGEGQQSDADEEAPF